MAARVLFLLEHYGPLRASEIVALSPYTLAQVETVLRRTPGIRATLKLAVRYYHVEGSRDAEAKGRARTKTRPEGPVGH